MANKLCPYSVNTCLCQSCAKSMIFSDGKCGVDCFECLHNEKSMHNIYLCTGYERRDADGQG